MRSPVVIYSLFTAMLLFCSCDTVINSLSFFPDRENLIPPERLPSNVSDIMIEAADGVKLQLLYMKHESRSGKALIYFHGNAGNLYDRMNEAEKIFSFGPDVIISGYRGYGRSTGEPTEEGVYTDGMCVLDYVIRTLGYAERDIFIYGRSIGTVVAVNTAMGRELAGLLLVTPLTSASDFIREKYPDLFSFIGSGHFDSGKKISSIKSPLLVIHGTEDEVIPYSLGVKLYDAYNGEKRFVRITGGGHNNLEFVDPAAYWEAFGTFLSQGK